ncbi:MAG TPA: carboxypeptidase-like regulatory domain-containing protein [Flavobacterium sp.]|jgi:hypothetical protein
MNVKITIPKPCSANWNEMTPVEKGRFCDSCSKKVFDFTSSSDEEIIKQLTTDKKICGRFNDNQLDRPLSVNTRKSFWLSAAALFAFFSFGSQMTQAQTSSRVVFGSPRRVYFEKRTIEGAVVDPTGNPIVGVHIGINGVVHTKTDQNGQFQVTARQNDMLLIAVEGQTKPVELKITEEKFYRIESQLKPKISQQRIGKVGEVRMKVE